MKSYILLPNLQSHTLSPAFRGNDVRYSEALVAAFMQEFTSPGDVVLDPFAGFGTTMFVAESMGRLAYGIEYDIERVRYARSLLQAPDNMIHGDALELASYHLPACDFSITSPPFMRRGDTEDPLTAYSTTGDGYDAYLQGLQRVYTQLADLMRPNSYAVIEAANLKGPDGVTTLAWDIAGVVGQVLNFNTEVVVGWEEPYGYGYDHSYCLVFTKQG